MKQIIMQRTVNYIAQAAPEKFKQLQESLGEFKQKRPSDPVNSYIKFSTKA